MGDPRSSGRYRAYLSRGAGWAGDPVFVVAADGDEQSSVVEYHIIVRRPEPRLFSGVFRYASGLLRQRLDTELLLDVGLDRAKDRWWAHVSTLEKTGSLGDLVLEEVSEAHRLFIQLWLHGHQEQLTKMHLESQSPALADELFGIRETGKLLEFDV